MPPVAPHMTQVIQRQLMFVGVSRRRPVPSGSSTKLNGTRKAGSACFQLCIVVTWGSARVIVAAAKGASEVGGETSESAA